jgi:hypothetical protein
VSAPHTGRVQAPAHPPRHPGLLRVTGSLVADAELRPTVDTPPHLVLCLQLQPERGLRYTARVDLGSDIADHLAAEALEPHLRTGAVLSVAAEALELQSDHGHAALRLVNAHSVVLLEGPKAPPAPPPPATPDLFSTPQPLEG